jgi:hypothetical protein
VSRLGLGLAALGRPGDLNLGHGEDLGPDRSVAALEARIHTGVLGDVKEALDGGEVAERLAGLTERAEAYRERRSSLPSN